MIDHGAIRNNIINSKGDLLAGIADNAVGRVTVGEDYSYLTADSSQTTGMKWARSGNLLTENVASGTDTLGTTAGFSSNSASLISSSDYAWQGTKSLKITASGTAARATIGGTSSSGTIPVVPGSVYHFELRALSPDDVVTKQARIYWWTSAGNVAASTATSSGTAIAFSAFWQTYSVTAVAPANAAFASLGLFNVSGAAADDVWYEDGYGFWQGAGGLWQLPSNPNPIANLGTYTDESVGRRIFTWDTVNNRWQMTYSDTGLRTLAAETLANGWTTSNFWLHRQNNIVWIEATLNGSSATSDLVFTLPSGYKPISTYVRLVGISGTSDDVVRGYIDNSNRQLYIIRSTAGTLSSIYFTAAYSVAEAWPTSLPGTAVGSIPQ